MCGKGCSGRSSTGGVRAEAREVPENWLEWLSSTVAANSKCAKQGSCTLLVANQRSYQG